MSDVMNESRSYLIADLKNINPTLARVISKITQIPEGARVSRIKMIKDELNVSVKEAQAILNDLYIPYVERVPIRGEKDLRARNDRLAATLEAVQEAYKVEKAENSISGQTEILDFVLEIVKGSNKATAIKVIEFIRSTL